MLKRAWVGPIPGHYKHNQFLCLSFPPYAAQRKGVAQANIRRCALPPLLLQGHKWLQYARWLGDYGWGWGLCGGAWEGTAKSSPTFSILSTSLCLVSYYMHHHPLSCRMW